MTQIPNPRFEVWSTIAWDGKDSLLAANLHFDRMERHASRLNFSLPDNLITLFASSIKVIGSLLFPILIVLPSVFCDSRLSAVPLAVSLEKLYDLL